MVVLTHPGLTSVDIKDEFLKGSPFCTKHRIQNDEPKRLECQRIHIRVSKEVIVTIVSKLDYFTYLGDVSNLLM